MRVYHERLRVPVSWWLLGLATILVLATELAAGYSVPIMVAIYLILVAGVAGTLLAWGRTSVVVSTTELRVGRARMPLTAIGRVTGLDSAQTWAMRGPRGDPAAFLLSRPYLREAVYVEVLPGAVAGQAGPPASPRSGRSTRLAGFAARIRSRQDQQVPIIPPYWLLGTRHPAELAAAIEKARPAAHPDGAIVG